MYQLGRRTFDTRPFRNSEAFERLDELNRHSPNPWTHDYSGGAFRARVEIMGLEEGCMARARITSNISSSRTAKNIAQSKDEYHTLLLMLSGSTAVRQGDATRLVRAGELCLLSGQEVTACTRVSCSSSSLLVLIIPRVRFGHLCDLEKEFARIVIPRAYTAQPLWQCLTSLASNFSDYSMPEATALFNACVHLTAAYCLRHSSGASTKGAASPRMGELLRTIERDIADPSLSPAQAAAELGISERHIHEMFASIGTTFRSHVSERRIRYAAADLQASPEGKPIAEIAYRWGFSELSTFRRAFRKVFGRAPVEFRRMR